MKLIPLVAAAQVGVDFLKPRDYFVESWQVVLADCRSESFTERFQSMILDVIRPFWVSGTEVTL